MAVTGGINDEITGRAQLPMVDAFKAAGEMETYDQQHQKTQEGAMKIDAELKSQHEASQLAEIYKTADTKTPEGQLALSDTLRKAGLYKHAQEQEKNDLVNSQAAENIKETKQKVQTAFVKMKDDEFSSVLKKTDYINTALAGVQNSIKPGMPKATIDAIYKAQRDEIMNNPTLSDQEKASIPVNYDPNFIKTRAMTSSTQLNWLKEAETERKNKADEAIRWAALDSKGKSESTGANTKVSINMDMTPGKDGKLTDEQQQNSLAKADAAQLIAGRKGSDFMSGAGKEAVARRERAQRMAVQLLMADNKGMTEAEAGDRLALGAQKFAANSAAKNAEGRTIGSNIGSISLAEKELGPFGDEAIAAIKEVTRSGYKPLDAGIQGGARAFNSTQQARLDSAIEPLIGTYARLISKGGETTQAARDHARELFSTARDEASMKAVIKQLKREIDIAVKATHEASGEVGQIEGKSDKPSVSKPTVSNW